MSQSRVRKNAGGDGRGRSCSTAPKVAENSVANNVCPKEQPQRSKSKNKIPKSMQYDLENALVSLCDLWFEEIKPHLVANQIKLHVHKGGPAGGDHACSHLDPGAASDVRAANSSDILSSSAADCELCRLLSDAGHCIESAVSQATNSILTSPSATLSDTARGTQNHHPNYEKPLKRRRACRRRQSARAEQQLQWRVPRLCRTNSAIPGPARMFASPQTCSPPRHRYTHILSQQPQRRLKTVNKKIQTETPHGISLGVGRQIKSSSPTLRPSRPTKQRTVPPKVLASSLEKNITIFLPNTNKNLSALTCTKLDSKAKTRFKSPNTQGSRPSSPYLNRCRTRTVSPIDHSKRKSYEVWCTKEAAPDLKGVRPGSPKYSVPLEYKPERIRGTTEFFPTRHQSRRRRQDCIATESPLFKDDLIEIIADKRDKRLRLLYKSPERDDIPSIMNLLPSPTDNHKLIVSGSKPPWK